MRVPWSDGRCIFCGNHVSTSVDHVIPQAIGGRLTSCFECASCGPSLGTRIEGPASVVLTRTPDSFELVQGPHGEALNLTDAASEAMLRAHLRREGIDEGDIEATITDLRARPADELFRPAAGYQIIRRTVSAEELRPAGTGPLLQVDVFALVAYRFLALVLGPAILDDQLDPVRGWFRGEGPRPESCVVTLGALGDFSYRPQHGIRVRPLPGGETEVRVAFFGTLCGDVLFRNVLTESAAVYSIDLATREEAYAGLPIGDG